MGAHKLRCAFLLAGFVACHQAGKIYWLIPFRAALGSIVCMSNLGGKHATWKNSYIQFKFSPVPENWRNLLAAAAVKQTHERATV